MKQMGTEFTGNWKIQSSINNYGKTIKKNLMRKAMTK